MGSGESRRNRWSLFGPILGWEMTTLVRRRRYFVLRALYALVLFLLLYSTYQTVFWSYAAFAPSRAIQQFSMFAYAFFRTFSFAQITAILFLTPAYVATAIALEKQRKTIEYLFTTDLGNHEIILSKLTARSLNVLILVFAGLPILSFAQFFGGIDAGKVLLLTILTVNCLLSTASLAILVSISAQNVRVALSNAYGLLVLLLVAPLVLTGVNEGANSLLEWQKIDFPGREWIYLTAQEFIGYLWLAHPYMVYGNVMFQPNVPVLTEDAWFWERLGLPYELFWMTLWSLGFSAVCIGMAIWGVRRVHLRQVSSAPRSFRTFLSRRKQRPTLEVSDRPMLWKEWRFDGRRTGKIIGRILFALSLAGFYLPFVYALYEVYVSGFRATSFSNTEELNIPLRFIGTMMIGLAYVLVAVRAANSVGMERDRDCWVSLLSTPLTGKEILQAKLIASLKPLFLLIPFFVPAWAMAVYFDALSLLAIPALLLAIFVYGFAIAVVGIYHSLRRKSTGAAIGATLATGALFGGIGHMFGGILMLPLMMFTAMDDRLVSMFYAVSLPWTVLAGAAFRWSELRDSDSMTFAIMAVICVIVYAGAAAALFQRAVAQFGQSSGRIEESLERSPTPIAIAAPSSQ